MDGLHCDVCKDIDGVETLAVGSCNDCTDNLCELCFANHKRNRMTRNHALEYKPSQSKQLTRPPSPGKAKTICQEHQQVISFFCKFHDAVGCSVCMKIYHLGLLCHQANISDIALGIRDTKELEKLKRDVYEIRHMYKVNIQKSKDQIVDIENDHTNAVKDIKETMERLTQLKQKSENEVAHIKDTDIKKMKSVTDNYEEMLSQIAILGAELDFKGETQDDESVFIMINKVKHKIGPFNDYLRKVQHDNQITRYRFTTQKLFSALHDMDALGKVSPKTTEPSLTMTIASGGGNKFGSKSLECSLTTSFGFKFGSQQPAAGKTETGSGFKFDAQHSDAANNSSSSAPISGFKFGTPTSVESNLFGTKPKTTETSVTSPSGSGGFKFGISTATSTDDVKSFTSSVFSVTSISGTSGSGGFKFGTPTTVATEISEMTYSATSGEGKYGLFAGTGALTTSVIAETLSSSSGQGQVTSWSAASMLSQLDAKHTEDSKSAQGPTTPASVAQTVPQKTVFKGFSFTSTPNVSDTKADNKELSNIKATVTTTTSAHAAKPFSGFSFTTPTSQTATLSSASSFGSRLEMTNATVVSLPDLIVVKTGEENEEKMFCERAKLFRYDLEAKQWKERGIGDIKILQHRETKKVRILMRREQVLKLCANHKITKEMKLTSLASSDKAWVWNAMDFSEEKVKPEKFAIRFKNADIAQKFKERFEQSQAEMVDSTSEVKHTDDKDKDKPATNTSSRDTAGKGSFAGLFKQKEGSWMCDGCYIHNNGDILSCPCCNTLKPSLKKEDLPRTTKPTSTMTMASGGGFKFGSQPTGQGSLTNESGFKLPAAGKTETGSGFKFGAQPSDAASSSSSPAPSAGFKFGTPSVASNLFGTKPKTTETSVTEPSGSGGFKFGNSATTTSTDVKSSTSSPFGTSASGSGGFKFGTSTTVTTEKSKMTSAATTGEGKVGLFGLPEPCKPSSGYVFSGSAAASSAGFNVNKGESKYPFGTPKLTETVPGEADSKSDNKTKGNGEKKPGESILAKFFASPDSWKCDGCLVSYDGTIQKCQCCGNIKPANSSAKAKTAGTSFGSGLVAKSAFSFGKSTDNTTSKVGDTANSGLITEKKTTRWFNFGAASGTTPTKSVEPFKFTLQPTSETPIIQPAASIGSGFNFSMNMTPTKPDVKSPLKSPGVKSLGIKLPGIKLPGKESPDSNDDGYYQEEDDSHIHVEPVIDLPIKNEVKTGEEDEEMMFVHRAKLFHFDKIEWKERGIGDVKVLYNSDTNKARIVMRREKILKICCNHYVSDDVKLKPMPKSKGCALAWYAMDFADGEPKSTQLSIKFKNADVSDNFESAVKKGKARIGGEYGHTVETIGSAASQMGNVGNNDDVVFLGEDVATDEEKESARALMLPDHFYLYERLPPCPGCRGCTDTMPGEEDRDNGRDNETDGQTEDHDDCNDNDDDSDDDDDDDDSDEDEDEDDGSKEEVIEERLSTTKELQLECKGYPMYSKQLDKVGELGSSDTGGGFVFGSLANMGSFSALAAASGTSGAFTSVGELGESDSDGGFVFGSSASAGSFAALAAASDTSSCSWSVTADESKPFHWQGAGKPLFGGRGWHRGDDGGSGDEGDNVQEGDDPHFEPIVPDLVEVKTGEEDETLEYKHRSKLYRYDKTANQWKEKGVGEMKILKHKETGKYRLLLRREQVHKLVCNHLLTPDLILTPMNTSETSWCWTAQDFSENEPKVELLAIKFKPILLEVWGADPMSISRNDVFKKTDEKGATNEGIYIYGERV